MAERTHGDFCLILVKFDVDLGLCLSLNVGNEEGSCRCLLSHYVALVLCLLSRVALPCSCSDPHVNTKPPNCSPSYLSSSGSRE